MEYGQTAPNAAALLSRTVCALKAKSSYLEHEAQCPWRNCENYYLKIAGKTHGYK
jgi:hypothetical protein